MGGRGIPLSDHSLVRDGWPHDHTGLAYLRPIEPGYAVCTCGEVSPTAGNLTYRRQWLIRHRTLANPRRR